MVVPVNKEHLHNKLPHPLDYYFHGFIRCKKYGKRSLYISDVIQMDVVERALSGQGYSKKGIANIKKEMEKIRTLSKKLGVKQAIYEKNYKVHSSF